MTLSVESIENSIVPLVDMYEMIQNLPAEKYSKHQYRQIVTGLKQLDQRVRIASYNILFDVFDDELAFENRWPQRLPRVVEMIEDMQADIIGSQEMEPNQLADLLRFIGKEYSFFPAESIDDQQSNGIFYRTDRFEILKGEVIYLNAAPTPHPATLTYLILKDLKTHKHYAVFNTHLAFGNIENRHYQVHFIANYIDKFSKKHRIPILLTGDFNTFPNRLDVIALPFQYLPFLDGNVILHILTRGELMDAVDFSLVGHLGPISSYTNAPGYIDPFEGTGTPGVILDHIFVSKGINVIIHAINPATVNGHFPSDHMPVFIDCIVEAAKERANFIDDAAH